MLILYTQYIVALGPITYLPNGDFIVEQGKHVYDAQSQKTYQLNATYVIPAGASAAPEPGA